jgi:Binding-protein-dependent transport system inner membrane component
MADATHIAGSFNQVALLDSEPERRAAQRRAALLKKRRRLQVLAIRLLSLVIVLGLWQIVGNGVDPVLFTTPSAVAVAAIAMIGSGELWTYLWPSLVVLAYGLALAIVFGIVMGLLLARFWVLDVALGVYVTFLYSTPSVALVPVIVLWVGFDTLAKTVVLFFFAFFPMVINTYQGVKNVDPKLLEVGQASRCPLSLQVFASPSGAVSSAWYWPISTRRFPGSAISSCAAPRAIASTRCSYRSSFWACSASA